MGKKTSLFIHFLWNNNIVSSFRPLVRVALYMTYVLLLSDSVNHKLFVYYAIARGFILSITILNIGNPGLRLLLKKTRSILTLIRYWFFQVHYNDLLKKFIYFCVSLKIIRRDKIIKNQNIPTLFLLKTIKLLQY